MFLDPCDNYNNMNFMLKLWQLNIYLRYPFCHDFSENKNMRFTPIKMAIYRLS